MAAMAAVVPTLPTPRLLASRFLRPPPPTPDEMMSVTLSPSSRRYPFLKATAHGSVEVSFPYSEIASFSSWVVEPHPLSIAAQSAPKVRRPSNADLFMTVNSVFQPFGKRPTRQSQFRHNFSATV